MRANAFAWIAGRRPGGLRPGLVPLLLVLLCPVRVAAGAGQLEAPVKPGQGEAGRVREQLAKDTLQRMLDEMVLVPGTEFVMGSEEGELDERPPHRVRLGDFRIGRSEVTQAQWRAVMGGDPSHFGGCGECPVEMVSWDDAQEFIRRATAVTGKPLRLPTEAEWECAAGGGAAHQRWAGTTSEDEVGDYAWHGGNAAGRTQPACSRKANRLGICDLSGNVWEWVADRYGASYYQSSPADNPTGPLSGEARVLRGGCWGDAVIYTRVAERDYDLPAARESYLGFRLALGP